MKYGHFDDKKREYVISTPHTPLPWINYLGQNDMFGIISNTAGGYCFYKDAKLLRITRYRYNNIPRDFGGRYYYIKDGETIFNPGFMPTQTELDSYECRHGLSYSTFEGVKNQIRTKLTCFIPLNKNEEVHELVITNESKEKKNLKVYGTCEWCLYNAVDDSNNFQRNYNTGEVIVKDDTVYHVTEYRERRNHFAYFHLNRKADGFDTDLDTFIGQGGSWSMPKAIKEGKSFSSVAHGWSPIAALRSDIVLNPGESVTLIYTLGFIINPDEEKFNNDGSVNLSRAEEAFKEIKDEKDVDKEMAKLRTYWDNLLSIIHVHSSEDKFDRAVNIWNQYQCMTTFLMSRSTSYYESGIGRGMGFRDSCQDILGFVHFIPEKSRQRILDLAAIQSEDGSTYHQYQPLTKKGNADIGGGFNDDPLWLIACTSAYLKETGDFSILNEKVPFDGKKPEATLYDHLKASVNFTVTHKGPHGLPLIGRADWNDCLNLNCFSKTPGEAFQTVSNFESGKAESVFIAGMFVKYGKEMIDIAKAVKDDALADKLLKETEEFEKAVVDFGWDGEWYLRAYDAFEKKVGSHENEEAQIFIEPQGFCTMAKIGEEKGLPEKAMISVEKRLVNDYGVEILAPCFHKYHLELGEITSYPPGYKENGSVFTHTNPWIIIAETAVGRYEEAFNIYKRSCPTYIEDKSDIRRVEPYVYCQTIAGREAPSYGEGKNSWLTGTASWSMVAVSQSLLGLVPSLNGLVIDPHLPKDLGDVELVRKYRGQTYNIKVTHSKNGKYSLTVDSKKVEGKLVKKVEGNHTYSIQVEII
ncbi:MAG: glycosyl transferase [Bacilli bacterium]|jgi:cellobiose phosphorylase|nr:glycosyl transferase [Bacilli bacterium]